MPLIRRTMFFALVVATLAVLAVPVFASQPSQPEQQNEFEPIDQLPPQDQLPSAPLLIGAYAFVAVGLFAYVVSVSRRLGTVQRELERLEADAKRSGRP